MKKLLTLSFLFTCFAVFCQDSSRVFDFVKPNFSKEALKELLKQRTAYEGVPLTNFKLNDTAGRAVTLRSLKSKIIVIHFWYIHCAPCLVEMPYYKKVLDHYSDSTNVTFISICVDRGINKELWKKQINEYGLHDIQLFLDRDEPVAANNRFYRRVQYFPTYLVADAKYQSLGCNADPDNDLSFIYTLERAKAGVKTKRAFWEMMNVTLGFRVWADKYIDVSR